MPEVSTSSRRLVMTVIACAAVVAGMTAEAGSASASPHGGGAGRAAASAPQATLTYSHLRLPGGEWAAVYSDGVAEVHRGNGTTGDQLKLVRLPMAGSDATTSAAQRQLPSRGDIIMDLAHGSGTPYAADQVVVVYRSGVTAPAHQSISPHALRTVGLTPAYTSVPGLNKRLARLGVDRSERLFGGVPHQRLAALRAAAEQRVGHALLDFSRAYVLHVTGSSVASAVSTLRASPDVAYASPNWTVTTSNTPPVPIPASQVKRAASASAAAGRAATAADVPGVPSNFTLASSAQSMLNRPANDVVPAFTALAAHGQLPGQGEIITNVSLGDLTDASAAANPSDRCNFYAANYGPTTIIQGNQRYLDWPSMPLIPTYTSDAAGQLNGTGETCGQDPNLTEVGLDFSMMAPLPHDQQRPGAVGSGLTDLLGIAPGASYRLVVPGTAGGAISDVDAAFLAAANQTPRPNVITASLSFGLDQYGFSSRYLEDDPLTEAVLASIVHGAGIVVCVSSGDGLRTFTNAAVPPSGGAVATDLAGHGQAPTDLNDVAFSSAVSHVKDSGAIDVGGSTLNDIFAAPPDDPRNAALTSQQAFPAVRYDGARNYASGFGDRVNVSAPGDNVLSLSHPTGGNAQAVQVVSEGGTSASAPEVAAAAAVILQAARLTRDNVGRDPLAVRQFLAQTGTPLPAVPQSDLPINVGPQVDVGRAVETLLARHGEAVSPGVARVAVVQRQQASALGGSITTTTDPTNIPLTGRLLNAWITVAPDWTGPALGHRGETYALSAASGPHGLLATTPWARLSPTEILTAAGLPVASTTTRTVPLDYTARIDGRVVAQASVSLTFGPSDGTVNSVPAPIVDPVVHGSTLQVSYDISKLSGATNPVLVVSQPGRVEQATGLFFRPSFTTPLTSPSGTISVPVSALEGAGIYGVGIQEAPGGWGSTNLSAFAFTRIAPTGDAQPAVPLVSAGGSPFAHFAEPAFGGSLQVSYDVRNVRGADGAIIEISAPGPTVFNSLNPFNNPNGSQRDANGHDSGSVLYRSVSGSHGVATLAGDYGLDPTMNQVVRVLATRHGVVTGEASGVSTVSMDGVRPSDGGSVAAGYGINTDGTDGFVTSNQVTAAGATLGSVETFRQSDNKITHVVRSSRDEYQTLFGGCPGQFAGDTGLYEDFDPVTGADNFRVLDPVAAGADTGSTWVPPASLGEVICAASQQDSPDTAILSAVSGSSTTLLVSTSQIAKGTFTRPVDLTPALDPNALSIAGGIGQDTSADEAVVPVVDAFNPTAPGRIVVVHLDTGQVTQFPSVSTFFADGIAVDSTTHKALIPSNTAFGLYDLAGQTGTALNFGGSTYQHPAADPVHHQFLMQEVTPPDFFGTTPNNNALSAVDVLDENGNLVKRIEKFNFFNVFLLDMGSYLQVSPGTSTGYTLGPAGAQLAPFQY